ncbi:MAG: FAD-dependent oxidoreductase [Pseudomonadota bacterium]
MAKKLGIRLPIQPVKGYSITTPVNGWDAAPRVAVIDEQMHAAVCPLGNFLRVAGTAEFAGYDHRVNQSRVNNLNSLLLKLYPDYVSYFNRDSVQQWAGLRPMTPDGVGITGPTKLKNLFINSGHGHLGWTMAPGAGQALADFMVSGSSALPLDEYSLSRF